MKTSRAPALAVAVLSSTLLLSSCSAGSGSAGATKLQDVTEEILVAATIDDTDGLVLSGEKIADATLLEAARADNLTWYTGSGQESAELTAARFEAETGVSIEVTRLPSSKLAERVLSEAGANRLGAGVITVTDPSVAEQLVAEGVYTDYKVHNYDDLAGMGPVVWGDGTYYTSYYSAYAFAYNTELVTGDDIPTKWADLVDPKWADKIGIVSAGAGGTVQGLAHFQQDKFGEKYWNDLAALKPRIFDTTSPQLDALARGEISVATAGFNSTYGAQKAGAPIALVIPEDGISGTFNMQGLTTTGLESPAAQLFMNWTMGRSGQEFAAAQGFVGVRNDIDQVETGPYQLPKADDEAFSLYTPEDATQYGESTVSRWNSIFGYGG